MTAAPPTGSTGDFAPGALVKARGREWVVMPDSEPDLLVLRPLGGHEDDVAAVFPHLEHVEHAQFPLPNADDLGDATSARLLRTALRIGFRASAGPFRSLATLAVEPRAYQYVPLLMALRQDTVRLLIADDVGIGKTIEAGLVAAELLAQGDAQRLAVLCSPALAEQWQRELREKFAIDAELVLPSTATRLARGLGYDESLFDRYPFVVVSTDFIKSPVRRHDFLNHCPELVIVDEAHSAVSDGAGSGARARTQRHELLRSVAADPARHLVLVTATPHSGKEEGFRNLIGLLDHKLATVNLDDVKGRELLARHFVQRRRADIRSYKQGGLAEDTAFPSDRETREAPYDLSPEYARFFDRVLDYVHEQVAVDDLAGSPGATQQTVRQRVRWWSALALLRTLASSPRAAAATLRTRASAVHATTIEEADDLGRAAVLDTADDEALEAIDATPGADDEPDDEVAETLPHANPAALRQRRRLLAMAHAAGELVGPQADRKLATLIDELKELLADGFDPIVFCRFVDTAEYVAEQLTGKLGHGVHVAPITGRLQPETRAARIDELTATEGRHVLVATDCLSEGINLQEHFQAVVHYDLAWNPTRHEQREGRVDRFGQQRDVVRAVTIYGHDNRIDGIVLDVLLRKHEAIRRATGVSVPVPDESDDVVEALVEGLMLRGKERAYQLTLDLGLQRRRDDLHRRWESAAEREKRSTTKYAQRTIDPGEVAREVTAARAALGTHGEVDHFMRAALPALGAPLTYAGPGVDAVRTATLPPGLRDALPPGHAEPLKLHRDMPVPRGHALLARTDPHVEAVARFVLDSALDPALGYRIAARAGVVRTRAVVQRTTLLLLRFRFHLDLPARHGTRQVVTEETRFLAFSGPPHDATWLDDAATTRLLQAEADSGMPTDQAVALIERVVGTVPALTPALDAEADRLAEQLREDHARVRAGARASRRGLEVRAQRPVDILGLYLWLPVVAA